MRPTLACFLTTVAACWGARSQCPAASSLVHFQRFDTKPSGPYTARDIRAGSPNITMVAGPAGNTRIRDGALELRMPRGCIGTAECGQQWKVALDPTLEAVYSFTAFLPTTFPFVKGGKLVGGVCGGTCPTGGRSATRGFSARTMWRAGGQLVSYLYFHGKKEAFGYNVVWTNGTTDRPMVLPTGQWFTVYFWVRLNTLGRRDGFLLGYFDGELAVNVTGLSWRKDKNIYIDTYMVSTFYGGSTREWAPPRATYILLGDSQVCTRDGFGWLHNRTAAEVAASGQAQKMGIDYTGLDEAVNRTLPGLRPADHGK